MMSIGILRADWGISTDNCLEFSEGKICFDITKITNTTFKLVSAIEKYTNTTPNISCDILTPDGELHHISNCNSTFIYRQKEDRTVKIYAKYETEFKELQWVYDFTNWGKLTTTSSQTYNSQVYEQTNEITIPSGFTQKQYNDVVAVYKLWPEFIQKIQTKYPALQTNQVRQDQQHALYKATREIVQNESPKTYINYTNYYNAIIAFIDFTKSVK